MENDSDLVSVWRNLIVSVIDAVNPLPELLVVYVVITS